MQPLSGVRVLDLSRILAGPHAAQTLGDLGAEVLKLEAPWGDDTRSWGPPFQTGFNGEEVASYFLSCNRGKRIETVNIKEEQERIRALVAYADVVVENFKPGTFGAIVGEVPEEVGDLVVDRDRRSIREHAVKLNCLPHRVRPRHER